MLYDKWMPRKNRSVHNPVKPPVFPFFKLSSTVLLVFVTYLIILPLITEKFVPCLGNHPFRSYQYSDCTVALALDRFMELALIGFSLLIICFWIILKRLSDKDHQPFHPQIIKTRLLTILVTSGIMAVSLITAYLVFLPSAESAVRVAPILLDSTKTP
jgi:hypothetical protein